MNPYAIRVDDQVLKDLRRRLTETRWPTAIPGAGWKYGADVADVRTLCDYWHNRYDWRSHERRLNRIPQFLVEIDAVEIHFFHLRAQGPPRTPLLLLHGWPGSSIEFEAMLAPLTDPGRESAAPAFDVVVPSLPGFGFSGKPLETGWSADRIASVLHTLMTSVLGYPRFGVQGGDWGTIIGTRMAHAHPGSLIGLHINMPFGYPSQSQGVKVERFNGFVQAETGYLHLQNTKPDALTVAQADSPAGLAAWVLEKFRTWSDCNGDVFSVFSKDVLLTNLMFYWATNSIASATRIYFESAQLDPPLFLAPKITVPTGFAALAVLDDAAFGAATEVTPKFISPADPAARWTGAHGGQAFFAYSTNYLIDVDNAIIVDVEATTAIRQAEVLAAKRMIERSMKRFDLYPATLMGDSAYGSAE